MAVVDGTITGTLPCAVVGVVISVGTVSSISNETSMTCPGDFDANGGVNVDDLLILLGEFGSCTKSCLADMNGDGDVDIDDMLSLIGVWGPC